MKIEVTKEIVPVIEITGEVDYFRAPELESAIDDLILDGNRNLLFDFSKADYIDSGGIEVLIGTLRKISKVGRLNFVSSNDDVVRLLDLVGVSRYSTFSLFSSKDEAIEDFKEVLKKCQ